MHRSPPTRRRRGGRGGASTTDTQRISSTHCRSAADTAGVANAADAADAAAAVGVVGLCPGAGGLVDVPDIRPPIPAAGRDDIAPRGVPVEGKDGAVVGLDGTGRGAVKVRSRC